MESQELLPRENGEGCNGSVDDCEVVSCHENRHENSGGFNGVVDDFEVVSCRENRGVVREEDILVNLDSYLDDVNDLLLVSQMVSSSMIKGMVKAVEQEAAEKIEAKEREVAYLKRFLQFPDAGSPSSDSLASSFEKILLDGKNRQICPGPFPVSMYGRCFNEPSCQISMHGRCFNEPSCQRFMSFEEMCTIHDNMMGSVACMRNAAKEELSTLKKSTSSARCSPVRRIDPDSQLVDLDGLLPEQKCQSLIPLDGMLDSVERIVDSICSQANASLRLSKSLLCDWLWERDLQSELEAFVMHSSINVLQEEMEQKVQCLGAQLCKSQSSTILKGFKQIACLREDLDAILKSLSHVESASYDSDHFHNKLLSNHSSKFVSEGNGKLEPSKADMPETFDILQLKHMTKDDLVSYFNTMITQMRRSHESTVQKLTEEYFSLKREYFKETGSSLSHKKDKEYDMLRKKISETIMKLDEVLLENNKIPLSVNDYGNFSSIKDKLDVVVSENSELRESLKDKDKDKEFKCLSSQLSDATQKVMEQSLAEEKLLQLMGKLRCDLDDAHIETAIQEDMCKFILHDFMEDIRCYIEETGMESILKQEICDVILYGAAASGETAVRGYDQDSELESGIMQGLFEVIVMETLKDAGSRMKEEISILAKLLEEKEKMETKLSAALKREKEQFELASGELDSVRQEASLHRALVFECRKELNIMKDQLTKSLKQIETDKIIIQELNQKLEVSYIDADEQRRMTLMLGLEKQDQMRLIALKEKELEHAMKDVGFDAQELFKSLAHFQCEVTGKIKANSLRIEDSFSQLTSLLEKAKSATRTGLKYRKMLERKCADLEKAEAEVDLLGDEVDTLLSLLEKIYIALRHYSPVLQHYPGIMEILKLMKREISGGAIKLP